MVSSEYLAVAHINDIHSHTGSLQTIKRDSLDVNVSRAMWHKQHFDWVYFSKLAIYHSTISKP